MLWFQTCSIKVSKKSFKVKHILHPKALQLLFHNIIMYSDTKASHIDMNFHTENNFHSARNEEIIPIPESINNISNEPCYNCILWKYKSQLLDNVLRYPNPRFCKQLMLQWQTNNSRVLQTAIRQYLYVLRALITDRWATIENLPTRAYLDPRFFLLCGLEIISITSSYFKPWN